MSKIDKFRAVINLIKDVKKRKHKGYVDLRWIFAASNDMLNDDLSEKSYAFWVYYEKRLIEVGRGFYIFYCRTILI